MVQASFESEYAAAADKVLNKTGGQAFDAVRMLKTADPAKYQPENGAEYPRSGYGEALRQIAQLIKADVGLEVAFAEAGGWDTTSTRGRRSGSSPARLDDFARGIAALARDLGDRMADVVILTMSEFGRAVAENGNRGTDHGHGNAMMIIGGAERPRRQGLRPLARPGARAALRRARPGGHDRLPQRVRGGRRGHLGRHRHARRSSPGSTDAQKLGLHR